jgi:FkbM family methyltransferase
MNRLLRYLKRPIMSALYFARLPPGIAATAYWRNRHSSLKLSVGAEFRCPCIGGKSVFLRAHTRDIDIYEQIFLMHDVAVSLDYQPKLIIDAGAHVGCSATFFASRFPGAKIIAVEAERRNYEQLSKNMSFLPQAESIHAAVWGSRTTLTLADSSAENWGFRVEQGEKSAGVQVPAVTINDLLNQSGEAIIDVLKLDIEGAEVDVLQAPDSDLWLARVLPASLHGTAGRTC